MGERRVAPGRRLVPVVAQPAERDRAVAVARRPRVSASGSSGRTGTAAAATCIRYSIYLFRPALMMAFLGWPTGRPRRAVVGWIAGVGAAYLALGLDRRCSSPADPPPETWASDPLARFDVEWIPQVLRPIAAWMLLFLPGLVVIVLLVRQQRSVPREAHHLISALTIAGIITFGTDLFMMVIASLGSGLLFDDVTHQSTVLGVVVLTENYAQGAVAAVGLAIAASGRRRASSRSVATERHRARHARQPLRHRRSRLQRLLDDPTARLLYTTADDRLIDADGDVGGRRCRRPFAHDRAKPGGSGARDPRLRQLRGTAPRAARRDRGDDREPDRERASGGRRARAARGARRSPACAAGRDRRRPAVVSEQRSARRRATTAGRSCARRRG